MSAAMRFVTPPSLRWCQDSTRVLVIDEQSAQAVSLTGLDAAVWKWLVLSYSYADVLRFTSVFLNLPEGETRARLTLLLNQWIELGLLVGEEAQ